MILQEREERHVRGGRKYRATSNTAFRAWISAWKGKRNFRKCAGLLVAQITSLTEGYLLLSEDPVRGGKMEWSQEKEGKGKTRR